MKWLWIILFFGLILSASSVSAAWCNSSYSSRVQTNVSENTGIDWTNYTVQLNLTFNTHMKSNFSDLMFYDNNCNVLPFYIENNIANSSAKVWVKTNLTGNTNNTIFYYFNNNAAPALSNIGTAFLYGTNTFADTYARTGMSFDGWDTAKTMVKDTGNGVRNVSYATGSGTFDFGDGDMLPVNFSGPTISEFDRLSFAAASGDRVDGCLGAISFGLTFTIGCGGRSFNGNANKFAMATNASWVNGNSNSSSYEGIGNDTYGSMKFRLNVNSTTVAFYANETLIKNVSTDSVKNFNGNYTYGTSLLYRASLGGASLKIANWTVAPVYGTAKEALALMFVLA